VVQGFLLDGIDAVAARAPVGGEHQFVAPAGAHEAQSALAIVELAKSGADLALDSTVGEWPPVPRRHDRGGRAERTHGLRGTHWAVVGLRSDTPQAWSPGEICQVFCSPDPLANSQGLNSQGLNSQGFEC